MDRSTQYRVSAAISLTLAALSLAFLTFMIGSGWDAGRWFGSAIATPLLLANGLLQLHLAGKARR